MCGGWRFYNETVGNSGGSQLCVEDLEVCRFLAGYKVIVLQKEKKIVEGVH